MNKRHCPLMLLLPTLLLLAAVRAPMASAADLYVLPGANGFYQTIQSAIDAAAEYDTVNVWSGTYPEKIDFKGKGITVIATWGAAKTIIDGGGSGTVVSFHSGESLLSVLNGFTVMNGGDSGIKCTGGSSPVIKFCIIKGNSGVSGGGILTDGSNPLVMDCTISGNYASLRGGGVHVQNAYPAFINCTIAGNLASMAAGDGVSVESSLASYPQIWNSILWGNGNEIALSAASHITVTYSDVAGDAVYPGEGNILGDPRFVSPRPAYQAPTTAGDYRIKQGSPCIDVGVDQVSFPHRDLEGEVRYRKNGWDIGSDEYSNSSFEYGRRIPNVWSGKNLTSLDGRVRKATYFISYCFKMTGSTANKSLRQEVHHYGVDGTRFCLSASSRSEGASASGGPYRVEVTLYNTDGSTTRKDLNFTRGTHDWETRNLYFTLTQDFNRAVIAVRYKNQTGTAWFDNVKLTTD